MVTLSRRPRWRPVYAAHTRKRPPRWRALQALLDAGARVVGKSQLVELAWSLDGINPHYGTPVNVAAPGRLPGGSSSGSAVRPSHFAGGASRRRLQLCDGGAVPGAEGRLRQCPP